MDSQLQLLAREVVSKHLESEQDLVMLADLIEHALIKAQAMSYVSDPQVYEAAKQYQWSLDREKKNSKSDNKSVWGFIAGVTWLSSRSKNRRA